MFTTAHKCGLFCAAYLQCSDQWLACLPLWGAGWPQQPPRIVKGRQEVAQAGKQRVGRAKHCSRCRPFTHHHDQHLRSANVAENPSAQQLPYVEQWAGLLPQLRKGCQPGLRYVVVGEGVGRHGQLRGLVMMRNFLSTATLRRTR